MRIGQENITSQIYGIEEDDAITLLKINSGTNLRGQSSCLVGPDFAKDNNIKIGSRINVGEDNILRVTGIIEERGMSFDINTDSAVVVSQSWFSKQFQQTGYNSVVIKVRDVDTIEAVAKAIEKKYNKSNDTVYDVTDTRKTLKTIFETFGQITTFVSAIGGISLVVAGVSILNIMMMSVTDRTKEIGIMRSIGVVRREVLMMFVYEALILGLIGSITGGVMSFIGGYLISDLMLHSTEYLFEPSSLVQILYGVLCGIFICLLCSLYPAWRAANLNPIDALRHE
jgi:putative ABC transport system permease protein